MIKATPIKLDVSSGFKTITLLVADFTPFMDFLGRPIEMSVAPSTENPLPDPANLVQIQTQAAPVAAPAPAASDKVIDTQAFQERPASTSGAMGAANADNPNACPLCYGHGLVKEFREGDTVGTPAVCTVCSGTGIKPAEATAATEKPLVSCTACSGTGCDGTPGRPCERCEGKGVEPLNPPTHTD